MKRIITILVLLLGILNAQAQDFKGIRELVGRRIPWLDGHVEFRAIQSDISEGDRFSLETRNNTLRVGATSPSAAAMAVNWYLKYYCHQSLAIQTANIKPLKTLPAIKGIVKQKTPFKYRYSLNYCTVSYTMSFYKQADWDYLLDWLALNGVNLALAPVGNEKVWDLTLQDFNFSQKEREVFIAGPAFSAWWLMGNLEGWGGPMSTGMIGQQATLQKHIIGRMRELGISPLMQGFYGMVPNALKEKYPQANIIEQGKWAGGFIRPAILSPQDPLFAKMAARFYAHTRDLYGSDFRYFGGDPFHEGGISKGVDLDVAGANIYQAMKQAFPSASWVLQGWGGNPSDKIISKIPKDKVLILDLMGENHENWLSRKGYNGYNWILGSVNNFGENSGFYGKLAHLATIPFKVLNTAEGKSLVGIGEIPEGYNNNPVLYDLIYDAAWQNQPFNITGWINRYADFRYGKADQNIKAAWQGFLKTIYNSAKSDFQGAPESVFCARPSLNAQHARTWGGLARNYDTHAFETAVRQFAKSADIYSSNENYEYDLVDLVRQVLSNRGEDIYKSMVAAYKSGQKEAFKKQAARFTDLMQMQDDLLQSHPNFRLATWVKAANDFGITDADKQQAVWNAKTQISYWGADNPQTNLHEYANKEWGGLIGTLYLQRWQRYISYLGDKLAGKNPAEPNFFEMEKAWANTPYVPAVISKENARAKALAVLQKLND